MQTKALNKVLEHLRMSFNFDRRETRKLLTMLHKTLTEAMPALLSNESDRVYQKSHNLHSELHMCGCEYLSDLATEIELQAKKGIIEQEIINDFLSQSKAFAEEIERWLKCEDNQ